MTVSNCSKVFDFHIFADDANLFYSNSSLLENLVNNNLEVASNWLMASKPYFIKCRQDIFNCISLPQNSGHVVKLLITNRGIKKENIY